MHVPGKFVDEVASWEEGVQPWRRTERRFFKPAW